MNPHLQDIIDKIQNERSLSQSEKDAYIKALREIDKNEHLLQFKLERVEKDRYTLSVMLEESIEDLQKKSKVIEEANATLENKNRELEIEAALEKVRSHSLAMHKSDELHEVVHTVSEKLTELNVDYYTVIIIIFQEDSKDVLWWLKNIANQQYSKVLLRYSDNAYLRDLFETRENGRELFTKCYASEEKNELFHYLFRDTDFKYTPDQQKKVLLDHEFSTMCVALAKNTAIHLTRYSDKSFSDEDKEILKKFARVFDQAYTRFLDLQRAEAQAREAKIEAALEKVRSRTMAMQKSDELSETATVLFQQFKELGEAPDQITIGIMNEEEGLIEFRVTATEGSRDDATYKAPIGEPTLMNKLYVSWKQQKKSIVVDLAGKELSDYIHFRSALSGRPLNPAHLAGRRIIYAAFFSKGLITLSTPDPRAPETIQLLERFAGVFDLTYTRFMDLKQAEAQAREAQVEAGLERVRSRAMAMQTSEELNGLIGTVFTELTKLDLVLTRCVIWIYEGTEKGVRWWMANSEAPSRPMNFFVKYADLPLFNEFLAGWNERTLKWQYVLDGENKIKTDDFLFTETELSQLPEFVVAGMKTPERVYLNASFNNFGNLMLGSLELLSDEHFDILLRFAKVFELTYTRFNDLKHAEAQAREATIEAALERVRAKAMAMHKSEDLNPAVAVVFDELEKLNPGILRCGIAILDKEKPRGDIWVTVKSNLRTTIQVSGDEPLDYHPMLLGAYDAWTRQEDFSYVLENEELVDYYQAIKQVPFQQAISETFHTAEKEQRQYYLNAAFHDGSLFVFKTTTITDEEKLVIKRFANVFNLTYKRFLDLQKAEAQAREATIEAALERVRAKAMAMHNSADLSSAVNSFFKELKNLGITPMRCGVGEVHEGTQTSDLVFTTADKQGELYEIPGKLKHEGHPVIENIYKHWKLQEEYHPVLQGKDINAYYKVIKSQMLFPDFPKYAKHYGNYFYFAEGFFFAWGNEEFTEEGLNICRRFTSVLSLTYKRYKDLKQAEAQAREAQIEAALERVRSKAMAMHKTEDFHPAVAVVFEELDKLDLGVLRCGISVLNKEKRVGDVWLTSTTDQGSAVQVTGDESFDIHPLLSGAFDAWLRQEDFSYVLEGDDLTNYYKAVKAARFQLPESQFISSEAGHKKQYAFVAVYLAGGLFAFRDTEFPDEAKKVMKRFANVFDLTYKRFQDLQRAEAQTREATIEAALERVRGKAMAMHNSDDVSLAASMVFTELRKLGISPIRCGVGLLNDKSLKAPLYSATSSADGDSLSLVGWVMLEGHPVLEKIYEKWSTGEDYFPELSGQSLKSYYDHLLSGLSVPVPDFSDGQTQYGHFFSFSVGCLYAWSNARYNDDEIKILKRFASIIDLTFRRYMDLQKSEANAKEAVKQAALDRIRADIASMRIVTDLDRITPLIWNELTILGLPFIRCGVFIMDDEQKLIHTFLSTPDGKAIAAFHLPYATGGNIPKVLENWRSKSIYTDHWNEDAFAAFANELVKQGALSSTEQYLSTLPKDGFYLHFLPFLQGMLYVGSLEKLNEDGLKLIQSVADAFSTAYARYEDFNKLEAAKKQVDKTLVDLKQAQQQLVQSEKMASLGELTAGIAHEIQNPLNFVNNFSEVSNELIEEMKQELETGNLKLATGIADDVKQNLEKILHHGKRADAIVKGMLQHSRTSSGQKELTDINALADEYLRLAYHGLRAKDKTFNAKFETDLDVSVEKVNVVPQEIGRVILNLINNAFYAVTEKKKQLNGTYEPTVSITTKKLDGRVEIHVKDNGNGIPQKLLDKIFQPFFTTKPTGQGTGLGLSLSYDIVTKGHGGELKVSTVENSGSEFIITLPT